METIIRHAIKTSTILALFAVIGTTLLAATHFATRDIIAESEKRAKLALIGQILPRDSYDNDLIKTAGTLPPAKELGNADATPIYRATLGGKPRAAVIEAVAPDGYAGKIKLLIAVSVDGTISGVRVVAHNETPGLGDYIDIAKSSWIKTFDGKSLAGSQDRDWKVIKDGGKFPYNSGATISPRAIVKAVHKALQYVAANRDTIFSSAAQPQPQERKQ